MTSPKPSPVGEGTCYHWDSQAPTEVGAGDEGRFGGLDFGQV